MTAATPKDLTFDTIIVGRDRGPPPGPPPPPPSEAIVDPSYGFALPANMDAMCFREGLRSFLLVGERSKRASEHDVTDAVLDLTGVGAWLAALQVVVAVATQAVASVLLPHALPVDARAPLRTLVLSTLVGVGIVRLDAFASLKDAAVVSLYDRVQRFAPALVAIAWASESIVYSACGVHPHGIGQLRGSLLVVLMLVLGLVAGHRAFYPRSNADGVVFLGVAALLGTALLPQTLAVAHNPLGRQLDVQESAVRVVRAAAFAAAFVGTTLAATPAMPDAESGLVLLIRCLLATVWLLLVPPVCLTLVVPYLTILATRRLREAEARSWKKFVDEHAA